MEIRIRHLGKTKWIGYVGYSMGYEFIPIYAQVESSEIYFESFVFDLSAKLNSFDLNDFVY